MFVIDRDSWLHCIQGHIDLLIAVGQCASFASQDLLSWNDEWLNGSSLKCDVQCLTPNKSFSSGNCHHQMDLIKLIKWEVRPGSFQSFCQRDRQISEEQDLQSAEVRRGWLWAEFIKPLKLDASSCVGNTGKTRKKTHSIAFPSKSPKKKTHTKHLHGTCPRARRHRHMPLPISPSCVTSDKLRPGLWQLLANRLQQVAPQSVCRQTWRWNLDTEGILKSQAAIINPGIKVPSRNDWNLPGNDL
jgi:hypothetical protein